MHIELAFMGRRATLLAVAEGPEIGEFELGKRRNEATATLDGHPYRIERDTDDRRRWHVRTDTEGSDDEAVADTVIERPSGWRSDLVLHRADGRRLDVRSKGVFTRRMRVTDPQFGDAEVARLKQEHRLFKTTWDLEVEQLADPERVAAVWIAVTTSRSDQTAGTAAVGGAAAASGG